MSINSVSISGNLTRDPELRSSRGGMQILNFSVAVNERRKGRESGEWEDYANYIDCVVFGSRAESLARHLSRGSKVSVSGKLHYSSWETDGRRMSKIEVYVDDIEFMFRKPQGGQQPQGTAPEEVYDAGIPF